jgi:hypothetical protein
VPNSVLDAIKMGLWDFEPDDVDDGQFDSTTAMPGTGEKLQVLAQRVQEGLPLWNAHDRTDYDEETLR